MQILEDFDEDFQKRVDFFVKNILEWNKIHNLTGAKTAESVKENILDSVLPLDKIDKFQRVLDIGTGAGFPGLIIAMLYPNTEITLVEPRVKRVSFLTFIKNSLKLKKVKIVPKRVEDFNDKSYDLITSRAVTDTEQLINLSKHLSNKDSKYLFYKGSFVENEIKNIKDYLIFTENKRRYLYIKEV